MGKTSIEWTASDDGTPGYTWNPLAGCTHVSAGCDHCYAATLHNMRYIAWKRGRFPAAPPQYHLPFKRVQLMPERLSDPLHWRKPRRVFVNSVSDLFHEDVPDDYIERVFAVMAATPQHTYQVLTKRPERMQQWVSAIDGAQWGARERMAAFIRSQVERARERLRLERLLTYLWQWPLPNVWLGTSVEHQAAADERIPPLLTTPAAVRFLSCEPLLEPVDLDAFLWEDAGPVWAGRNLANPGLDWVICGGESGAHARPMDLDWARSLRDQCVAANVAYFFKQVGGRTPKANGRLLDGREWSEYPNVKGHDHAQD